MILMHDEYKTYFIFLIEVPGNFGANVYMTDSSYSTNPGYCAETIC